MRVSYVDRAYAVGSGSRCVCAACWSLWVLGLAPLPSPLLRKGLHQVQTLEKVHLLGT